VPHIRPLAGTSYYIGFYLLKVFTFLLNSLCVLYCSLSAIYDASSRKVHRATRLTVRNGWGERLPMEPETSHRAGLNFRQPSRRSRWCCRSRLWMETQRPCWPTRPPLPRSSVSNCRSGLVWRISSDFHCTLLSLTRWVLCLCILLCWGGSVQRCSIIIIVFARSSTEIYVKT